MGSAGSDPAKRRPAFWGLDVARLFAMGAVVVLHLRAIEGRPIPSSLYWLGVPVFAALSGYLAGTGRDAPGRWLRRRLARIYYPYWISLAAMFAANALVGYKPVSLELFLSQFVGVAAFTSPGRLLGVHTWFVGFILACYLLAALVRWRGALLPIFVVLLVAATVRGACPYGMEFVAFFAGLVASRAPDPRLGAAAAAGGAVALWMAVGSPFGGVAYGAVGLLLGTLGRGGRPPRLAAASELTYAFYLVHGLVYLAIHRLVGPGLPGNLLIGTPVAIAAAWLLDRAASGLGRAVDSAWHRLRADRASGRIDSTPVAVATYDPIVKPAERA